MQYGVMRDEVAWVTAGGKRCTNTSSKTEVGGLTKALAAKLHRALAADSAQRRGYCVGSERCAAMGTIGLGRWNGAGIVRFVGLGLNSEISKR